MEQKQKEIAALQQYLQHCEENENENIQAVAYMLEEIDRLVTDISIADIGVENIMLDMLCEYRRRAKQDTVFKDLIATKLKLMQKE